MFTGIVQAVGRIAHVAKAFDGLRLEVDLGVAEFTDVAVGDSVCVSGCCLTVAAIRGASLEFDVSAETLRCTTGLDRTGDVNIELALRLADRIGGHLTSGHVDGVGTVTRFGARRRAAPRRASSPFGGSAAATAASVGAHVPVAGDAQGSSLLEIEAPAELARFIAPKGSIAVDGVSLTVNEVAGACFAVNVIPHTLTVTTLSRLTPGAKVNLEIDIVARYIARLAQFPS